MDYVEQERFLKVSRYLGATCVLALTAGGALALRATPNARWPELVVYALTLAALAVSLAYTPGYLHLTVYPRKRARWQAKMGWPVIGAAGLIALPFCLRPRNTAPLILSLV
jgi:hypothetical protein